MAPRAALLLSLAARAFAVSVDDLGKSWTAKSTLPNGRAGFAAVVLDGTLYILGGYDGSSWLNNVYSSVDSGITWTTVASSSTWSARQNFGCVVLNSKVFVFGGESSSDDTMQDVYSAPSSNLSNFTEVTSAADWTGRSEFATVVFNDAIYVMGGSDADGTLNDVWSSSDGATWTQVTSSASWTARAKLWAAVLDNTIFLMGGWDYFDPNSEVYSSTDGATWTQVTSSPGWPARLGATAVLFEGQLLLSGGVDGSNNVLADVWRTEDGETWEELTNNAVTARKNHVAIAYGSDVLIMGGDENVGGSRLDEIHGLTECTLTSVECNPCSPGYYKESWGVCDACPAGTYQSERGVVGSSYCLDCDAGTYSASGASACTNCKNGTYSPNAASAECTDCAIGTYGAPEGSDSADDCIECPAGTIGILPGWPNVSACEDCQAGKYQPALAALSCLNCPAGTYYPSGLLDLVGPASAMSDCIDCPVGSTSDEGSTLATDCETCPAGKYGAGGSECTDCPAGTYGLDDAAVYTSVEMCMECIPGTYKAESGTVLSAGEICDYCPAGKWSTSGASECYDCAAGKYAPYLSDCQDCPAGTYGPSPGLDNVSDCVKCPPGTEPSGEAGESTELGACVDCAPGNYSADGENCTVCPLGYSCPTSRLGAPSICAENYFGAELGLISCVMCPPCAIGMYGSAGPPGSTFSAIF